MKKLFAILLFVAACGASVKDEPLTSESWQELKNSNALTMQEAQFLNAFIMSQGMRSATDTTQAGPFDSGFTIGEAIEEGRMRVEGMGKALDDAKK